MTLVRASSAKTGVPVHNLAFASVGGIVEGVSEGGSLYEPCPWRSKISASLIHLSDLLQNMEVKFGTYTC